MNNYREWIIKLILKQRIFPWFDSYDIYDENGNTAFVDTGLLPWGHLLKIYDAYGNEVGSINEKILILLPKYEMYLEQKYIGCISKEFSLFMLKYNIDYNGWHVEGNWFEWYNIIDHTGRSVASILKEIWKFTNTYVIDIYNQQDDILHLSCYCQS